MAVDMLDREINISDFVIMYNNIYEVTKIDGQNAQIILVSKSKTTKSAWHRGSKLCLLHKEDILMWKLKGGF
jgi:hypothetical protein